MFQIVIISISSVGLALFWFNEGAFFNSYLSHVLRLKYIYIAIMVSLSAMMGLIFVFVFGVLSDNTRTKIGRRRPYLLFGVIAGISMILFSLSPNFFWCLFFDVIIIGVAANAYLAAHNSLIPDIVDIEYRGRANSIIGIVTLVANLIPFMLTLVVYEYYTRRTSNGEVLLTQSGHFIMLLVGGMIIIICSIIAFIFIREPLSASEMPHKKTFMEELKQIIKYSELKKHSEFFKFIIANTIYNVGNKIIGIYLFLYIFALGLTTMEIIIAICILIPSVGIPTLLIGKLCDRYGRKKFVPPLLIIASIGCLILPFGGTANNIIISVVLIGAIFLLLGTTTLMIPIVTWQQDLLPEDKRGQFIGLLNIQSTLNQIPAAFLAAFIADVYGVQWIFIIIPFFFLSAVPMFLKVKETLPNIEKEI
ncbi:MAG: MFS transporter [Promethearchaeota archaeon]